MWGWEGRWGRGEGVRGELNRGKGAAVCPDEMEQLKLGFGGEQLFLLSAPSRFCDNIKVKTECQSDEHQ